MRTLRGYLKTAAMAASGVMGDDSLFLVNYLMRLLRVALFFSLWRLILHGRGEIAGYTLGMTLTYTLISEVCRDLLECRTWLEMGFWDGSVSTRFLRPMGIFAQFAAEWSGAIAFHFVFFSLPLLLLAPLFGVNPFPPNLQAGLLFILSLALAVFTGLGLEYLFSGVAIALRLHPYVFNRMRGALGELLSGALLPFAFLPFGLGKVFAYLPFAGQASTPLSIYVGGANDAPRLMALQVFWGAALWIGASQLWNRNREKVIAYGG